jgi:hypothetical protein
MTFAMFRVMALELWRDRGALVMTFLLPPLVFLIFSAVFSGATGEDIKLKLAVADEARTVDSRRLLSAVVADPDLRADDVASGEVVRRLVRSGRADAGPRRPSPLDRLFVGHHRHAQADRARPWRHDARVPQGDADPQRPRGG